MTDNVHDIGIDKHSVTTAFLLFDFFVSFI